MKHKILILVFVLLTLFSFNIYGVNEESIFENTFTVESKFSLVGSVTDDYNEGKFRIDEGIHAVFKLDVELPTVTNFKGGYTNIKNNDFYECFNVNLSLANSTKYGGCTVYVNQTGTYYLTLITENGNNEYYIFDTVEVIDAFPKIDTIIYIIISIILIFVSLLNLELISKFAGVIGALFLLVGGVDLINTYSYNTNILLIIAFVTLSLLTFLIRNVIKSFD